jgi:TolB protein
MKRRQTLSLATFFGILVAAVFAAGSQATASDRKGEIAFTRQVNTVYQVFTVRPDGTRLRQVTHGMGAGQHGISWSPNGRGLLYTLGRIDGTDRIAKSRADGNDAAVISPPCKGGCLSDDGPTYSPDGKKIAFERAFGPAANHDPTRVAIFTMNADGSHLRQLTQKSARTEDGQPQWSPDGTKIAFVRTNTTAKPTQKGAIEIMNADGSHIRRLTPFRIDATDPHWSPNGQRLLFNTWAHPTQFKSANLFIMNAEGTHRVALTHYTGGTLQAIADAWSPDGTQILFHRMALSGSSTEVGGFYILHLSLNNIVENASNRIQRLTSVQLRYDARAAWGRRTG